MIQHKFINEILDYINIQLNLVCDHIDNIIFGNVPFHEDDINRFYGEYDAFYSMKKFIEKLLEGHDD